MSDCVDNKCNYGKRYKGKNAALSQYDIRRLIRKARNSLLSASNLKLDLNLSCSTRTIRRTLENTPHLKSRRDGYLRVERDCGFPLLDCELSLKLGSCMYTCLSCLHSPV